MKNNEIQIFNFQDNNVRVINIDNEPWFVGKDVCERLGYTNPNKAMNDHCKGITKRYPLMTAGGMQEVRILSEADVMRLICGSTLPEAQKFERWVFEDVLPCIRRRGAYVATNGSESPEELYLRALTALKDALDRQKTICAEQEAQLRNQAPDVEYCKRVLAADNLHTINAIAVHLGVSAVKLNKFLSAEGWIYRRGSIWYPAAKLRERSLCDFHVVPYINSRGERVTREHLKWTESGRRAVIDLWHRKHN